MISNPSIQWAMKSLEHRGFQLQSEVPLVIQNNPWSSVYRFSTNHGYVFLKQMPSALALEPKVIKILRDDFLANVPFIIDENQELDCFLMKDAGIRLYDYFNRDFNPDLLTETLQSYIRVQLLATNKIQLFMDVNVPDWSLNKLPLLYQNLIAQEALLLDDGLTIDDIKKLNQLQSKLSTLCEKLLDYKIKDTFGHADFHDKNILIDPETSQTTIIDLGEVVITYPIFSLLNCIHRAKENFHLTDSEYQKLLLDCLKPWLELESMEHLHEIILIINQCWPIHSVLGEYRLMQSVHPDDFNKLQRQGRLANNLRHWLNQ